MRSMVTAHVPAERNANNAEVTTSEDTGCPELIRVGQSRNTKEILNDDRSSHYSSPTLVLVF